MNSVVYKKYVKEHTQKTNEVKTLSLSFLVGGLICCVGQGFIELYSKIIPTYSELQIGALTSVTMIFLGVMAKMFVIAGPIIITGVSASVVMGIIFWLIEVL